MITTTPNSANDFNTQGRFRKVGRREQAAKTFSIGDRYQVAIRKSLPAAVREPPNGKVMASVGMPRPAREGRLRRG